MSRETTQDQLLRDLGRVIRRQRLLILAAVLAAVGAAIVYSILKTPTYEASSELQFNDQSRDLSALGVPVPAPADPAKQAAADAEIITSSQIVRAVQESVGGDLTVDEVRSSIETALDPDSNLVTIQTTDEDADVAAQLANAFAQETKVAVTRSERARLEQAADRLQDAIRGEDTDSLSRTLTAERIAQLESLATLTRPVMIARSATTPEDPVSPQPVRDIPLALLLGLIFGTLGAFLRDSLDRRLTDAHDAQHHFGFPMVAYVESYMLGGVGLSGNGAVGGADLGIEPFRILRSNVEFLAPEQKLQTVAVTSPVAQEGKSTVAAGLAIASAFAGKQVLLVECDLRRPVFARRLNLPESPGLTDWAVGAAQAGEVLRPIALQQISGQGEGAVLHVDAQQGAPTLTAIVAGSWSPRPAELLGSQRFANFLQQVRDVYDLIVLDCAPLLPVGDALEVLPQVDAALVCIRLDQTTREQALAAKATVEHLPPRPTGLVITGVRPGREGYYYGYYSAVSSGPAAVVAPPSQPGGLAK